MDSQKMLLISLVAHLAEYIDTGEPFDIQAAQGLLHNGELADLLMPSPLVPLSRSGKSIIEMIEKGGE